MRNLRGWIAVALAVCALAAAPSVGPSTITMDEYRNRRAALRRNLDGVLLLFSSADETMDGYFQEPNFRYLTGWNQPGAVLIITPNEEMLFLPPHNPRSELYEGTRVAPEDPNAQTATGFEKLLPVASVETELARLGATTKKLYVLDPKLPDRREPKPVAAFTDRQPASTVLTPLRMRKSPAEIAILQRAADATVVAHRASWERIAPGIFEYQAATTLTSAYRELSCERNAYPPIVGSGPNSVILHYSANRRRMDRGELVVMDAGGECAAYATDVTRTVPAGGKFSARQREIYDIVLGAQKAAIAAVKPGIRMGKKEEEGTLNYIAWNYVNTHGKDLHGDSLGKYFVHGLGHHVGLEVHDPADGAPLEPGMIITIEPGIYIPEENIGIRIEDMVLVTGEGSRVMTAALPREAAEIERLLRK